MILNDADINTPDQFGNTAFWHFYNQNNLEKAFFLIDKGANINHIDNYGVFPLKKEVMSRNLEMIKKLLDKGADPNFADAVHMRTCLHTSVNSHIKQDSTQILKLLLSKQAKLDALDFKRRTPVHYVFV